MRRWRVPAIGAAAALLLAAVYFVGFHRPRGGEIASLKAETDRFRAQRAPLQREIAGLQDVAAREGEFRAALERLDQLIPSGLAQPTLLAQLQGAAEGAGVKLVSVTFEDPEVPEGAPPSPVPGAVVVAMPLTVVVDGPYLAITDMLRRVEGEVDRGLLVGTVAMTEADAGFPQLTGTWSGQAYALLAADDPLLVDPNAPTTTSTAPGKKAPVAESPEGGS